MGHLWGAGQESVRVTWSSGLGFCMHYGNHYQEFWRKDWSGRGKAADQGGGHAEWL